MCTRAKVAQQSMHTGSTAGGTCGAISILLALERLLITNHQSKNSPSDLAPSHAGAIPTEDSRNI